LEHLKKIRTKAVILFSGGIDSTVALAMALEKDRECYALSFDYGQRHRIELDFAKEIAKHYGISLKIICIDPSVFGKTSLVGKFPVPKDRSTSIIKASGIPNTYVPARNTLFLAYALGQAEILEASEIYVGFNDMDNSPYPDCRPAFVKAFQGLIEVATKQSVEGRVPQLLAPIISMNKTEIIQQGLALNAPLHLTFSCYDPTLDGKPCGRCDACRLRIEAFRNVESGSH
jgi:7-cyano-7-deazaguanine synthase